jgi:hypothetical protein
VRKVNFNQVGKEIEKKSSHLECSSCGKKQAIKNGDVGLSLKLGWQKCCGYTMILETK